MNGSLYSITNIIFRELKMPWRITYFHLRHVICGRIFSIRRILFLKRWDGILEMVEIYTSRMTVGQGTVPYPSSHGWTVSRTNVLDLLASGLLIIFTRECGLILLVLILPFYLSRSGFHRFILPCFMLLIIFFGVNRPMGSSLLLMIFQIITKSLSLAPFWAGIWNNFLITTIDIFFLALYAGEGSNHWQSL